MKYYQGYPECVATGLEGPFQDFQEFSVFAAAGLAVTIDAKTDPMNTLMMHEYFSEKCFYHRHSTEYAIFVNCKYQDYIFNEISLFRRSKRSTSISTS